MLTGYKKGYKVTLTCGRPVMYRQEHSTTITGRLAVPLPPDRALRQDDMAFMDMECPVPLAGRRAFSEGRQLPSPTHPGQSPWGCCLGPGGSHERGQVPDQRATGVGNAAVMPCYGRHWRGPRLPGTTAPAAEGSVLTPMPCSIPASSCSSLCQAGRPSRWVCAQGLTAQGAAAGVPSLFAQGRHTRLSP